MNKKELNLNTDFYNNLPGMVCEILEEQIVAKYGNMPDFKEAWEEYRQHVLSSSMENMRMPGYVFKKYALKWDKILEGK